MVTGLDDNASIERAFDAGTNDFVTKPINWTMLSYKGKYLLRAGRAFKALDHSRSRLVKTQELARLGNWQIDLSTIEFSCSSKACRLLGIDVRHQTSFSDFLSPIIANEREKVKETIDRAVQYHRNIILNYAVILPDGTQKHILNQGEILFNENGTPEMLLGVIQVRIQIVQAEYYSHHQGCCRIFPG